MPTSKIKWIVGDGDWATPGNWDLGRLPGAADKVLIDTLGPHTVTHGSGDDVVQALRIGAKDDFNVAGGSLGVADGASFSRLLITGGTLVLDGRSTAGSLVQSASLAGAGTFIVSGEASVNGLETGSGTTILKGASTIDFLGLDGGRTLENRGVLTMSGNGEIDLGVNPFGESLGGATLRNDVPGVIDLQGVNHIGFVETPPTGDVSFTNEGTLRKSVSAGPAYVDVLLVNLGAIQVETGVLEFDTGLVVAGRGSAEVASGATLRIGGGGIAYASAFTVAAGGTLEFAGHIFSGGRDYFSLGAGTVGGTGTVAVTGGELGVGFFAVTVANFVQGNTTQSGSIVSGPGTFTVTGAATFAGGAMRQTGSGVTLLEGPSALSGNVGGLFLDGGRTLENQGIFDVLNGGLIEVGGDAGGATLRNDAGGTLVLEGVALIGAGAAGAALINAGTLEKTDGPGAAVVGVAVMNTGAIRAEAFTLEFLQRITGDGTLAVESGATLELDGGAAASLSMAFKAGGGTLALHHAGAFAATIHGFAAGDVIDLLGKRADRAVLESGDRLAIFRGDRRLATLQLAGDYAGATFSVASDGAGGTDITVTTPSAIHVAAAPAHLFIDAMAGFGDGHGGPVGAWAESHAGVNHPGLCAPRRTHFA